MIVRALARSWESYSSLDACWEESQWILGKFGAGEKDRIRKIGVVFLCQDILSETLRNSGIDVTLTGPGICEELLVPLRALLAPLDPGLWEEWIG